ncbi:MAG: 50S ribosomal protein L13 [Abditibacteriales bacterium]|nr:50S ribosomal protein L13 [Abditibacteriales bacterium]MDW8367945.1 50S ribosomal protein L13 [Abditibacteriales bacterium]
MVTSGKTYAAKPGDVERQWYVVDAAGQTLGRLATKIATVLRGKHKPTFTPHLDTGDYVIVINADKVTVTGKKMTDKIYYRHTGYPGGLRETNLRTLLQKKPEKVIELAVWGMLPHNRLGRRLIRKLHVYAGDKHPHAAQRPKTLEI